MLESIKNGVPFSHPHKKMVAKGHTGKKRTVYTFGKEENHILKLITYLMIRKYDHLFQPSLYSFRSGHSVSEAIRKITRTRDIRQYYSYKVDISNYFNSSSLADKVSAYIGNGGTITTGNGAVIHRQRQRQRSVRRQLCGSQSVQPAPVAV